MNWLNVYEHARISHLNFRLHTSSTNSIFVDIPYIHWNILPAWAQLVALENIQFNIKVSVYEERTIIRTWFFY